MLESIIFMIKILTNVIYAIIMFQFDINIEYRHRIYKTKQYRLLRFLGKLQP